MWATMEFMTSKAPLIALVSLATLTAACSSSISLTDEPSATLGTPETTIVSTESSAPEQTTEKSAPTEDSSGDTDTTESSTPETTAPEQDAESTTTTVEPAAPAEPELDPEIAAARDDLQSQYASSRLYGPIVTERCGVRAGILIGPEQWGPLADSEDSRIPEAAMFNWVDNEWVRTDHISYESATQNGVAAAAFASISFINVDGYDEPLLVRAESTSDGNYVTTKKLDSNCRWWDRPIITLCGVNRTAEEVTGNGSMTMVPQSLYDEDPLPCERNGSMSIRWNPEFQMIEPAVSGADWCNAYVSEIEAGYPLTPCTEGATISAVQDGLAAAGYNIDADGFFGPGTMRTIMRYQQSQGLEVTGRISADLALALGDDGSGGGDS